MSKKIITCFVMITFLLVIVVPHVEAGKEHTYSNKADWSSLEGPALVAMVAVGIGLVWLIIWGVSKAKKKTTTEESQLSMPEEDTSSLTTIEKANMPTVMEPGKTSDFISQNIPVELSDTGLVVLKW